MTRPSSQHVSDDDLEAYSLGRLTEPDVAQVEEHLLICAACCAALVSWDEYLQAMKPALLEFSRLQPHQEA